MRGLNVGLGTKILVVKSAYEAVVGQESLQRAFVNSHVRLFSRASEGGSASASHP